ncbi:ATP-dependent Clp protease ATP-binding subunit [Clostridium sporogenes]|nr:ATP-dependent Clp protease ATP-binding subunit [Clostridium sporogenes]NFS24768.1 ATP-dependent Clp protease ATP-binding subunit [Clostridium sporogenes]
MEIKVYFMPRKVFDEKIEKMDNKISLSQIVMKWTNNTKLEDIVEKLYKIDTCIITLEDCSGLNSHVLENFDCLLAVFEKSSDINTILINNPPKFFFDRLKQLQNSILVEKNKYKKINARVLKKVRNNFDKNIVGQSKAKKAICRKLIAHMIRPSNKPLVLMFYGNPGIGKTETAKILSKTLFSSGEILREQMTMVGGDASVKYFKSTSHNEDSFSKRLLNRTSNVILLDEFALAPRFFQTSFFQMFDEGIYADQNFTIDMSNSIIICTSNLLSIEEMEENIDNALLSRFDGFIHFTDFTIDEKRVIATNLFNEFINPKNMNTKYRKKLNEKDVMNNVEKALPKLINVRNIRKYVEDCIADNLLNTIIKK